jgi:hypothetical protein
MCHQLRSGKSSYSDRLVLTNEENVAAPLRIPWGRRQTLPSGGAATLAEASPCRGPPWGVSLVPVSCEGLARAAWHRAARGNREHWPERLWRRGGIGGNATGIGAADVPGGAALSGSLLRIHMRYPLSVAWKWMLPNQISNPVGNGSDWP